jgi:hypothetical protein
MRITSSSRKLIIYIYIPQQKYYESATSQHNHRNLLLAINEGVDFDCPLPPTGRP